MEPVIVSLGERHRVVIDNLNHTLQEFRPARMLANGKMSKDHWEPLGYYDTLGATIRRVSRQEGIEPGEYTALEYANAVYEKASELCKEVQG